jgi:hypothetical protein
VTTFPTKDQENVQDGSNPNTRRVLLRLARWPRLRQARQVVAEPMMRLIQIWVGLNVATLAITAIFYIINREDEND